MSLESNPGSAPSALAETVSKASEESHSHHAQHLRFDKSSQTDRSGAAPQSVNDRLPNKEKSENRKRKLAGSSVLETQIYAHNSLEASSQSEIPNGPLPDIANGVPLVIPNELAPADPLLDVPAQDAPFASFDQEDSEFDPKYHTLCTIPSSSGKNDAHCPCNAIQEFENRVLNRFLHQ